MKQPKMIWVCNVSELSLYSLKRSGSALKCSVRAGSAKVTLKPENFGHKYTLCFNMLTIQTMFLNKLVYFHKISCLNDPFFSDRVLTLDQLITFRLTFEEQESTFKLYDKIFHICRWESQWIIARKDLDVVCPIDKNGVLSSFV